MEVFDFIGTKLSDFLTYTGFANAEMGNWIMTGHQEGFRAFAFDSYRFGYYFRKYSF